jgi:hypothetical protein
MKLWEALADFKLIPDTSLIEARQIRFPRSKRRRIRRKWSRRQENLIIRPSSMLLYDHSARTVVGHPAALVMLRAKICASKQNDPRAHNGAPPCFEET